jgi:nicotinate-nucleotide pyrophosphorylase (carboxylating)
MPSVLKDAIRKAVVTGGGHFRISKDPFIYLDKNYIRMFGGIKNSLQAVNHFKDYKIVVQIKGEQVNIATEACEAADGNADIIFIDSGKPEDILAVDRVLIQKGLRNKVRIAFGGNVKVEDIDRLKRMPLDILEIGRNIVDAPLLDLRLDVVEIKG